MNTDKNRLSTISVHGYTWRNAPGNVEVSPACFFYPRTKEDIALIIQDAEANGMRVRAVGSGHSYSEAAKGQDYLLSMKRLNKVWKTDCQYAHAEFKDKHFVTAEAGTTLKKLNKELDDEDLALANMGVIDFQTISGALMTGTHGTGIAQPAVPDMVRAIRLVGNDGKYYQIEPSQGMTDPSKLPQDAPFTLIQDDDHFYSTVLSFGAMGIVYELILEVVPIFWIKERKYMMTWTELRKELESGAFMEKVRNIDFVSFRANPYKVKGDHRCVIVEQRIIPFEERPRGFFANYRNLISTFFGSLEYFIEQAILAANDLKKAPKVQKNINRALWASSDLVYFAKSYKALLQDSSAVVRYGISSEFAFDASATKIISVIESIFKKAKENTQKSQRYQTAHIPVRFVQASKAYLSSAFERETVYIDVPVLFGSLGDIEILEDYQELLTSKELNGIPHWGKHNRRLYFKEGYAFQQFSKAKNWVDIRRKMDPKGTFLSDFIIQMGLK